jgi:hypothetical protein
MKPTYIIHQDKIITIEDGVQNIVRLFGCTSKPDLAQDGGLQ